VKKFGTITGWALAFPELECPFCGARTVYNQAMPWCTACGVEYYVSRKDDPVTGRTRYVFDNKRKTQRFAFAKAVIASGGVRMGRVTRRRS